MDIKIIHDRKNQMFTTTIDDSECYLRYNFPEKNVIDFYSTYVPGELRGKGIAALLVEEGLNYAEKNNLRVIPSCSYVSVYIQRNEKFKYLLESDRVDDEDG